jgi:hypothetical protein
MLGHKTSYHAATSVVTAADPLTEEMTELEVAI